MKLVISGVIKRASKRLDPKLDLKEEEIEKFIEIPPSTEMGDYAFPCFFLASRLKMSPQEIALNIREKIGELDKKEIKDFSEIQTQGPYINFFIDRIALAEDLIEEIITKKDNYGKIDLGKGKKALIEHTSINPNASPHVGRARNSIIGDSIVRILKFMNYKTEVHYYVNDVSKQIAMLALTLGDSKNKAKGRSKKKSKPKFEDMLKHYIDISKKVKENPKMEAKVFDLLYKFEHSNRSTVSQFKSITSICVKGQEKILSELGIKYDYFDYESKYLPDAKNILGELEKTKKLFKDQDGRLVLDLKGTSVEGKMKSPVLVLTRNDSTGLYPLRDISYTLDKLRMAPEKNIIILGEDQKLYFEQIKESLRLLKSKFPEVVHYSFILLSEKGKSKKMSTRKGDVVLLEDFLRDAITKAEKEISKRKIGNKLNSKKVGISAVKYAILKNNPNKTILFNLDEALAFEGDTGPYLLYSYARANSILNKIKKNSKIKEKEIEELDPKEIELIKKLSQFKEIILKSYEELNPSLIANYSYQLAQIFNEFYHACPVINSDKEFFRLKIVESFKQVLKNSLNLLGIETIDKM